MVIMHMMMLTGILQAHTQCTMAKVLPIYLQQSINHVHACNFNHMCLYLYAPDVPSKHAQLRDSHL